LSIHAIGVSHALLRNGALAVIGTVVGEAADAKARGFAVHAILTHPDSKRLGDMAKAVARGELLIPIATRLSLRDAQAAHDFAEGGAGGKVLLIP